MKKQIKINGIIKEARSFKTLNAAKNFMEKNSGYEMVYFRAHEYIVAKA